MNEKYPIDENQRPPLAKKTVFIIVFMVFLLSVWGTYAADQYFGNGLSIELAILFFAACLVTARMLQKWNRLLVREILYFVTLLIFIFLCNRRNHFILVRFRSTSPSC